MQFDREKLKDVVLYSCSRCEPHELGQTKLHKILYFADMISFANTGMPITGADYRKRPHGPTCDALLGVLEELVNEKLLEVSVQNYFGYRKKEFHALAEPGTERFNEDELLLVDEVIEFVCKNNSARTISEFSHNRAWEMAEFGEVLPYVSAFYMLPSQVSKEAFDWVESEVTGIEAAESRADTVDLEDYRAFRSRLLEAMR
jgi:hypothetical protein